MAIRIPFKYMLVIFLITIVAGCATKYDCKTDTNQYSGEVCGMSGQIYCVKAPCPRYIQETYPGSKAACEDSRYYTKGSCRVEGPIYSIFDKWGFEVKDGE